MFGFLQSGFKKLKVALSKTRNFLSLKLKALFKQPLDETTLEQIERILYEADFGTILVEEFIDAIKTTLKKYPETATEKIVDLLREKALETLHQPSKVHPAPKINPEDPLIILIVGVNGSGKTTTIAKLAKILEDQGEKVLLVAGDTFRAAATEQLSSWAGKLNVEIVKGQYGSDPSSVAFDALTAAKSRGKTVVIIDTAGRLQNKLDLMKELEKVCRVCKKVIPNAPHETFLILDATSGQNGLNQAETFHQFTPLTGIILTKVDGTAKGGIILAIYQKLKVPIRYLGIGEKLDDLIPFDAENYVTSLFEEG
ncbi:MAG: signal recognition particle-docking protein FtsY [Chlamydiae bacterium]|nr:signal recognition particle-docking protein FtsY [Chlamydiota bacterium]